MISMVLNIAYSHFQPISEVSRRYIWYYLALILIILVQSGIYFLKMPTVLIFQFIADIPGFDLSVHLLYYTGYAICVSNFILDNA